MSPRTSTGWLWEVGSATDCEFERGSGRITMQVVKKHGEWRVLTFNVNSDLLMEDNQP